ncbi:hypothetical protein [Parafrankia discariae]|uniref:hypothetical protein n=1 Tax=Parafrankia discariae TaxID=365528 RepID=UPI00037ABC4A|nr:hypothetical protein [Parafrankia discariae]
MRFAGYRLLTTGDDAWQRMAVNLRLLDDADERLRAGARADLTAWLDHEAATTHHPPSRDRAAELDSLIERTRPVLGERRARLLRFHAGLGRGTSAVVALADSVRTESRPPTRAERGRGRRPPA